MSTLRPFRYDPNLKRLARDLRKNSTLAEVLLWQCLNRGQRGYDFHRQKPVSGYILDFFAPELMLAVEIDGTSHRLKGEDNEKRQLQLERLGIRVLRFDDAMVKRNLAGVVMAIDRWTAANRPGS